MDLLFFCTRWGYEHIPWDDFCRKAKSAGYDGIETSLPSNEGEQAEITKIIKSYGLKLIGQHWDTVTPDFEAHVKEMEMRLRLMAKAEPLFITSHTGKDFFTFQQNEYLLNLAHQISINTGVKIIHETHRGKFSFGAHVTRPYLEKLPWLRLTLDISHWFAVAESNLSDQQDTVNLALMHSDHIHARVGYQHGPQVSDPAAPEWRFMLDLHLNYWLKVIEMHAKNNAEYFTITPEFGPHPYMPAHPYTKHPLADQWNVNLHMVEELKKRYIKRLAITS